jgi:eukaryotic-like serine/threonine-protein kinase
MSEQPPRTPRVHVEREADLASARLRTINPRLTPALPLAAPSIPTLPNAPSSGSLSSPPPGPARPKWTNTGSGIQGLPQAGHTVSSSRGNYTLQSELGRGAFGAVFRSVGPFDQVYAIKVLQPGNRAYAEVQAEWAKESGRLMSLRHPNVVYIHDAFEQNQLFFLALEHCDHPLKAMLGRPLKEGLVIELARQLLAALQFLHDNDVVHEDLHPGNVLITHTDRPLVKISDFGISNELRGKQAVRPSIVHHAIMAPEILATGYTTKQSDIYQVGLLLYWLLTGEPAINMNAPYEELLQVIGAGEPRRKAEALGTPLGQYIAKMLRRREAYRYASAREIWADLREVEAWKNRELFPTK